MFVHHDTIHKLLQLPYESPYCVLKRADKHYTLHIAGWPEVVSLDCLKPAYLESDLVADIDTSTQEIPTVQPTKSPVTITRSGRPVHMSVHFIQSFTVITEEGVL